MWLVRHGEATHNVDFAQRGYAAYTDPKHRDSLLTALGEQQAMQCTLPPEVELVVVSPLQRALQTAEYAQFASSIPVIVLDCVREFPIGHTPNIVLHVHHPIGFDYSQAMAQQEDWSDGRMETSDEVDLRVRTFCEWLSQRPEQNIAVISHSSYLNRFMRNTGVLQAPDKPLPHVLPIHWVFICGISAERTL